MSITLKKRDAIIQALNAGVVPRLGLEHIQVGRKAETAALIQDIDRLMDSGSSIRFVIGEYGAGKTFFLHVVRQVALEKGLVVVHADLGPDRRLQATNGCARLLYGELMRNLATRTKPDGGALASVVERFIGRVHEEAKNTCIPTAQLMTMRLSSLEEWVSGYDFAAVIAEYWRASESDDAHKKSVALRWLRGEWSTKTEARRALGLVRTIIDDANVYDYLKLMSVFVRLAGYKGFLVILDEMVNVYTLQNAQSRAANYEQILRIINDVLQGCTHGLGFVMSGTPEFLMDERRGMYSYPALQSRLAENIFAQNGLIDFSGPIVRLNSLTPEDLFVVLSNIRAVFASGQKERYLLPDLALQAFMQHCAQHIGPTYFRTPRHMIKAFVHLLSVLEQNPGTQWESLLTAVTLQSEVVSHHELDCITIC